ncbi:MAG: TatD family hydrolase [Bacteroidales bacterium]|nr:TatD family hydrolase [Bacteroidales bacterium]
MTAEFTDTHAHLYLDAYGDDAGQVVERAINLGVTRIFLPNLNSHSIKDLHRICDQFSETCFPMMGLHPTSVKENYREELDLIRQQLQKRAYIAIGEIGIDLYWDKTFLSEQTDAFRTQLRWAKDASLPVVIHARDSFDEIFSVLDQETGPALKGVFHSFTGNATQAAKILSYGFFIGINGIVTFKNGGLDKVVKDIPVEKLLIETDAPFLAPVPYRGKRNESAYVIEVAKKIAEIYGISISEIAKITTQNALNLFRKAS